MAEKTIPWWRKALTFALDGIRSGFGLFSHHPRPPAAIAPEVPVRTQHHLEEETALTDSFPQSEEVLLVPEAESALAQTAAAEPAPVPELASTAATEVSATAEPVDELDVEPEEPATEPIAEDAEPTAELEEPTTVEPEEQIAEPTAEPDALKGPDFSANQAEPDALEGHDFSRADEATSFTGALAPEGSLSQVALANEPAAEAEPVASLEPEGESEPHAVANSEIVPDPVAESEALSEPIAEPAEEAEPTAEQVAAAKAEEKNAAKLAARQKKLDEGSEQSPFSVLVGQVYDGPLDLLLDLIRKQDIDIYDIPIAKITAQFLAYVNQLKAGDMDVAGEFIYTASLLIHIKSKMLLPRATTGPDDASEDPRRELVERLLEHERFKNAAQMLQQKQMLEAASWTNPGSREFKNDEGTEPEIAADTVDLVRIFRDILERARKRPIFNLQEDSVTVGQMIQYLSRRLTMDDKPVALRRLLSHTRSERALIAMFLALLELVRLQAILLRQDLAFSEIFIKKNTGFDSVMSSDLINTQDDWR